MLRYFNRPFNNHSFKLFLSRLLNLSTEYLVTFLSNISTLASFVEFFRFMLFRLMENAFVSQIPTMILKGNSPHLPPPRRGQNNPRHDTIFLKICFPSAERGEEAVWSFPTRYLTSALCLY